MSQRVLPPHQSGPPRQRDHSHHHQKWPRPYSLFPFPCPYDKDSHNFANITVGNVHVSCPQNARNDVQL